VSVSMVYYECSVGSVGGLNLSVVYECSGVSVGM
jgi:hypothetical protein